MNLTEEMQKYRTPLEIKEDFRDEEDAEMRGWKEGKLDGWNDAIDEIIFQIQEHPELKTSEDYIKLVHQLRK